MYSPAKTYIEHNSPHTRRRRTSAACMWHVVAALVPSALCSLYYFGWQAGAVILCTVAAAVLSEWLITRFMMNAKVSHTSLAASALTGILLAMSLPSCIPLWVAAIGAVFAIGIGKMAFGGLGCNIFNPAMVGRVFLLISFPVAMTTWPVPGSGFVADGTTGATVLSALKEGIMPDQTYGYTNLLVGNMGGSLGEVASIALLIGFVYLLAVKVISWHIPVSIIATVFIFDWLIGVPPGIDILSGGVLLGAIFMATDYVTSPMAKHGMIIYGVLIGVTTVVIRQWGAYPEGISFAILLANGVTPLINRYVHTRRFGYRNTRKEAAA